MNQLRPRMAYRIKEFSEDFSVPLRTIYREVAEKKLPIYKVGATTYIAGEDAMAWRDLYRNGQAEPQKA